MDADADADRAGCESIADLGSGSERVGGLPEGNEESIPLRVDLDPAVAEERISQRPAMLGQHLCIRVAELVEQPRRALDVGEEEGDRPGRELTHNRNDATD
jgi:hypothetical protein